MELGRGLLGAESTRDRDSSVAREVRREFVHDVQHFHVLRVGFDHAENSVLLEVLLNRVHAPDHGHVLVVLILRDLPVPLPVLGANGAQHLRMALAHLGVQAHDEALSTHEKKV